MLGKRCKLETDLSGRLMQLKKAADQTCDRRRQLYVIASKARADYAQAIASALEVDIEL